MDFRPEEMQPSTSGKPETELAIKACSSSAALRDFLLPMVSTMKTVRKYVERQDYRSALNAAKRTGEPFVAALVLQSLAQRKESFALDTLSDYVQLADVVLASGADQSLVIALDVVSQIVMGFGQQIKDVCSQRPGVGVDLSYEDRKAKYEKAKQALLDIKPTLDRCASSSLHSRRALELGRQISMLQ